MLAVLVVHNVRAKAAYTREADIGQIRKRVALV